MSEQLSPINRILVGMLRTVRRGGGRIAATTNFRTLYLTFAVLALFGTTVLWAVLGAHVQVHNADQLSDPYLFTDWKTFHGAYFPIAHTFLLKWPVFWLLGAIGITSFHLLVATVAVALVTVAGLAFVLYKIDRRPLVLGTLYLAVAFALLLVPAQPYSGGILPINMAMLATRNIEYLIYIICLVLFIRGRRMRSLTFVGGVVLLGLLIASDRLFLGLALGGGALALIVYALCSNAALVLFAARWLVASTAASAFAAVILIAITGTHLTHLSGGSDVSPYVTGVGPKDALLGVVYGVLGLITNVGANPVFSNVVLGHIPHDLATALSHPSSVLYLASALVAVLGSLLVWRLVRTTLRYTSRTSRVPASTQLALALLYSTVAAFGLFVVTHHYYAVDARYLSIGFFAVVISAAAILRTTTPRSRTLVFGGLALTACIVAASFTAHAVAGQQTAAFAEVSNRDVLITQALKHHKVDMLVGDYWRVLPIRLASQDNLDVLPLGDCTNPTTFLTSSVWHPNLAHHSFAYLVTVQGSLTDYPSCDIPQITKAYGRPNSVQIIAGTPARPQEALLFYDDGSHPQAAAESAPASLLPIGLDQLAKTGCAQPTILNVVAHEDDDLLFLSPDLLHELHGGDCVRTVFMTAGDAGGSKFYWLSRQLGSEAAYSKMLGIANIWNQQTLAIAPGKYITVATPRDSSQVSLVFLNLPDGNLQGQGFPASGQESLAKLYSGDKTSLRTVDGQSNYTLSQLQNALVMLMDAYEPAEIHTQADVPSGLYPDHSDHITTGKITSNAAQQYDQQHFGDAITIPVFRYIGYPVHGYDANLSGPDLEQKEDAFFAYGQYDNVCQSVAACATGTVYGFYLSRQYQQ